MPEAVYPVIVIAVILTVQGFMPNRSSHRILTEVQEEETRKSLKLQEMLTEDFGQNQFEGKWMVEDNVKPLNFFNQINGIAEMVIYSFATDENTKELITDKFGTMVILLLDPLYHNKKVIRITLRLSGFEVGETNTSWGGQQNIQVYTFEDHSFMNNHTLFANFSITDLKEVRIQADKLNLVVTMGQLRQYHELPFLVLIPSLLMLLFMELAKRADIPQQKLSLVTISIIINFLMYVSLLEVYRGIELEKWLVLNGALTFGVVVKFTQTFEPAIRPINTIRGYMTFYCLSLIYFIGLFNYYHSRLFILLQGLWLVPQIVHNIVIKFRPGFYPSYLAMILVNQLYIIYFKGYSDNIFRQSPQPFLCVIIVILDIIQILFLYFQNKFGVRFIIPKRFRTNFHNYQITLDSNNPQLDEDCSICLLALRIQQPNQPQLSMPTDTTVDLTKITKIKIMQTPCNHKFHSSCLMHWMQHKLECPLDKKVLPPIQ